MILGKTDEIIKAAITAQAAGAGAYGDSGLLAPEQADSFIDMIMDTSEFLRETSYEKRIAVKGTISLLGVSARNFRKKIENSNQISGNEVRPVIADVPYETVGITLGTEISNDWYRQNIERENFENHFMSLISQQIGLDTLDLALNGDTASTDPFENINDGWLKRLLAPTGIPAAQRIDGATLNGGNFTDTYFYELLKALPRKYFNQGGYKWICSHRTKVKVMEFLRARQTAAGDAALVGNLALNPLSIPFTNPTGFPDDLVIFGDPKQLMTVWTYNVGMRKTVEGKELVAKDNRFYAWFFDLDHIVRMPQSFTILTNVGDVAPVPSTDITSSQAVLFEKTNELLDEELDQV